MKKYFRWILFIILVIPISVFASTRTYTRTREKPLVPSDITVDDNTYPIIAKIPAVDSSEKVYDFADIFTDRQENLLYKELEDYIRTTNIEAVIVTVDDIKEFTIDVYASHFYRYNDFLENGTIFAIYTGNTKREYYMKAFGERALSIYNNMRQQQILSFLYDTINDEKYYTSMNYYMTTLTGFYSAKNTGSYYIGKEGKVLRNIPWVEISIVVVSFTLIGWLLFLYKLHNRNILKYKDDLTEKIDDTTLSIEVEVENFLGNSIVKK